MTPREREHRERVLSFQGERRDIEAIVTSLGALPPSLREHIAQTVVALEHTVTAGQSHRLLILLCKLAYAEGAAECAQQMAQRLTPKDAA